MKRPLWTRLAISIGLAVVLAACNATPAAPPTPAATSPAAPETSNLLPFAGTVVASAEVVPAEKAEMSFAVSALVKEVLVGKGDTVKAGQPLMVLSTPSLELGVQEAEWMVLSAQALYDRSRDPYKKVFSGGKVVYAAGYVEKRNEMEAGLQAAQAKLDAAKYELAQGTLFAPFDGVIVDINITPGEFAQSGQVALTLADTARMQIETTDLSERDVPAVKIGQTVKVYIEALNFTVTGRVTKISPMSKTVGGDVVYPVTIELDEQPRGLLWGMSAEAQIETE